MDDDDVRERSSNSNSSCGGIGEGMRGRYLLSTLTHTHSQTHNIIIIISLPLLHVIFICCSRSSFLPDSPHVLQTLLQSLPETEKLDRFAFLSTSHIKTSPCMHHHHLSHHLSSFLFLFFTHTSPTQVSPAAHIS